MRRSVLGSLAVLGAVVCGLGGTGLFAALTDTARSGHNAVETPPLAASADLQLARAASSGGAAGQPLECGTFSEDLEGAFFAVENAGDQFELRNVYYCLRNVGSQPVTLSAMVDELRDLEAAADCTGDEAAHGDVSCGVGDPGELGAQLMVRYQNVPQCSVGSGENPQEISLPDNAQTAVTFGQLQPGEVSCFELILSRVPGTPAEQQRAQSDRVSWRFKWIGQA